jgi:hypothetical protein
VLCLQVDLGRINALIAQNAGLKAMLEEEHLQLEVRRLGCATAPLDFGWGQGIPAAGAMYGPRAQIGGSSNAMMGPC